MVIICPECSTKFRVNAERIPEHGVKVRCARCKHVFHVEKSIPEQEPESLVTETPVAEEPVCPPVVEEEQVTTDFGPAETEESSFSYDQFREFDTTEKDETDFTFGGAEEDELIADEPPAALKTEADKDEPFSFSGDNEEATEIAPEESSAQPSDSSEEKAISEESNSEPTPDIEQAETATPIETIPESVPQTKSADKSSSSSSLMRLLLLLLLGLAVIAGAIYYVNGPDQINQVIQQIFGQQSGSTEKGRITLADLEGKFVTNHDAGEIFIIRGKAINNFREARASIQVKGVIFDPNGKPLLQKTIFCGNPISDQELQTLPFSKLEEMMRNQFGKSMNNMQVSNKESISFTIAFRDLPKDLSEFSVDITSSEPAAK